MSNTPTKQQPMSLTTTEPETEPLPIMSTGPADELLEPNQHKAITELLDHLDLKESWKVNSATWAFFWGRRADLTRLRRLRQRERASRNNTDSGESGAEEDGEPPYKKRRVNSSDSDSDSDSESSLNKHEDPAEKMCKQRDGNACVLTGALEPIVIARILPYDLEQLQDTQDQKLFWSILKIWYEGDERIDFWKRQVKAAGAKDSCANMLCMSIQAYHLWAKARFALRPVTLSEDKTILTVQFYWLPRRRYRRSVKVGKIPPAFPDTLSASYTLDGKVNAMLFDLATLRPLCSGDLLVFKTDDPVARPMPSLELLDMQWCLHRMLALSGVPDATDEQLNPKEPWEKDWEPSSEDEEDEEDEEDDG